jgi:hypothetical protein
VKQHKVRAGSEPPPPNDDHFDAGYDEAEWDGDGGPAPAAVQRAGPGLEALKLSVHRPEDVGDRLAPVLFIDPVQRAAFTALVEHDDLHDAIATGAPEVARLLRRVTVEEPLPGDPELGDPVDSVVNVLLREAARLALSDVTAESRGHEVPSLPRPQETAEVRRWLAELDDPDSGRSAADLLVAWLTEREKKEE